MSPRIDPISFEVIRNALSSIADEMALVLMRSAYSPVVRDSMDYSTALCDRHGAVIAQGLTLAVQLGAFPDLMRHIIAQVAISGGMATADSLVQQVLGHGLAAKLSQRLGEGVLNGLLIARLGLAAIDVTRPLPFTALPRPALADLAKDLLRKRDDGE